VLTLLLGDCRLDDPVLLAEVGGALRGKTVDAMWADTTFCTSRCYELQSRVRVPFLLLIPYSRL
jgi:hypothetical protein